MYCGNCGKEIDDRAAFCPECGNPVNTRKSHAFKINIKKIKRIAVLCLVLAVLICAGIAGFRIYTYFASIPSEEEIRIAANNLQNGGQITYDGKWLYYIDQGLCKVKINNINQQNVISSDIVPEEMFYLGNTLYYYTFPGYYQLTDAGTGEDLGFSVFTKDCIQTDGKYFYVTGMGNFEDGSVYAVEVGNMEKVKQISDIHPTKLLLNGDYLYIISGWTSINNMPNEYYGVWRINKDGSNMISLLDFCPTHMAFSADTIYYTNKENQLCSMSLDGSSNRVFEDIYVGSGLNATDSYVFYVDRNSETIYRMNADGTGNTKLNTFESSSIYIAGDWLFYVNEDFDYEIYQMSFDGSYNKPIY